MHELRAECAEAKVSADTRLDEARGMMDDALKKFTEAEAKLRAAESLEAEASRYHRAAERKLHEVEAREDDLRRRLISFKSEYVLCLCHHNCIEIVFVLRCIMFISFIKKWEFKCIT